MTANQRKLEAYQQANRETAAIILENPEKFGGEESLLVRWARLVLRPPTERSRPKNVRAA
jgi:hypothetical protein